ncbi:MAG: hypothetical protein JWQ97_4078 [Phenylobacterium sp.]|nr:hypothetical protein [Phenylobacterium sp.]
MSRARLTFPLLALAAGLAGCADRTDRADAPLSATFGQAVASLQSQVIPPSPDQGATVSSAVRGAAAIRRYERGQPRPLEAAPTSSLAYAPAPPPGGGPEVVQ